MNNMKYIETRFPPDYYGGIQKNQVKHHAPKNKIDGTTFATIILVIVAVIIFTSQLDQSLSPKKNNTNQYE